MLEEQPKGPRLSLPWLFRQLDEAHRKEGLKHIAERGDEYFSTTMGAAMDALGLTKAPPARRLGYYYRKTIAEWEEQRGRFPEDFEDEQADFERLRDREAKGGLVPEFPVAPQVPAP